MITLYHHPFCPHSRFVRIAAGEYGLNPTLIEERPWERRDEFLMLNPAGTTPVLLEEGRPPVPGASVIAEYLEEIYPEPSLLGSTPRENASCAAVASSALASPRLRYAAVVWTS